ncbi:MAG: sigma-70 family RNA polymerase sigma factor [Anaerolineae bacterium]
MSALSDSMLLRRFRDEGDETSFEELFTRHYDRVYGVLFRLTGTRQQAEDLAQEVFLKLYQRPMRRGDNVAGWLYRVAMNSGYNALRGEKRRDKRERFVAPQEGSGATPEESAIRGETREQVRAALARLKPRDAKLLVGREMGLSYKQLAEIVGVRETSVGTLLSRAQSAFV